MCIRDRVRLPAVCRWQWEARCAAGAAQVYAAHPGASGVAADGRRASRRRVVGSGRRGAR
eukprot:1157668-Alexandrium_andersonii.AAC.1